MTIEDGKFVEKYQSSDQESVVTREIKGDKLLVVSIYVNPLHVVLFNLNFHQLEVVSR